jgi:hypothetical protein
MHARGGKRPKAAAVKVSLRGEAAEADLQRVARELPGVQPGEGAQAGSGRAGAAAREAARGDSAVGPGEATREAAVRTDSVVAAGEAARGTSRRR